MSSRDDDDDSRGVVWAVLIGAVLLAVSLAVGMGLYRTMGKAAPTLAGASNQSATAMVGDGPSIVVENGMVKFYFASGKADLAPGAAEALADVVRGVAAGKKAVISGFHDETGGAALNAELAKQRAMSVRDALAALGVRDDQMDLRKPEVMLATGSNAEARRVEVRLE